MNVCRTSLPLASAAFYTEVHTSCRDLIIIAMDGRTSPSSPLRLGGAPSPRTMMSLDSPNSSTLSRGAHSPSPEEQAARAQEARQSRKALYTRIAEERAAQERQMEELSRKQEEMEEMLRKRNVQFKAMVNWRRVNKEHHRLWSLVNTIRSYLVKRALNTWVSNQTVRNREDAIMYHAVLTLANVELRKGLTTWRAYASAAADARNRMRAAAVALRHGGVRKALTSWAEKAAAMSTARAQLHAAVAALRSTGTRRALNAWSEAASEAARQVQALHRAAVSIRNVGVRKQHGPVALRCEKHKR